MRQAFDCVAELANWTHTKAAAMPGFGQKDAARRCPDWLQIEVLHGIKGQPGQKACKCAVMFEVLDQHACVRQSSTQPCAPQIAKACALKKAAFTRCSRTKSSYRMKLHAQGASGHDLHPPCNFRMKLRVSMAPALGGKGKGQGSCIKAKPDSSIAAASWSKGSQVAPHIGMPSIACELLR